MVHQVLEVEAVLLVEADGVTFHQEALQNLGWPVVQVAAPHLQV